MSVACHSKSRPDMSTLAGAMRYARSLGRGMVVFRHPLRSQFEVVLKSHTHKYDLSWVKHEVNDDQSSR